MTTTVTIKANHGWPVDVKAYHPDGSPIETSGGRVPAGETRDFHVHSGQDLFVHEVQPDEAATPFTTDDGKAVPYGLGDEVELARSGEQGEIIGVGLYARTPPMFLVEYVTADGRQTENWFLAEAITRA
ncbi:hypothetical protein [Rhizobium sp. RU36D]|uniref:hypothetical protein n=1 Tax=Rhizobium sp. RU36D TaxID=1907415 RepID=UPI0009D8D508|nr:hypothetical protein [Rhizobium sp. RU36D]SMD18605.1 hypothetical protein SAMN05880593_13546 [Rhizobium sp. RU36D]